MGSLFVSGAGYQCTALADNDTAHKGKRGRSESFFLSYLFIFNFSFVKLTANCYLLTAH
jgi:hypothetical protein